MNNQTDFGSENNGIVEKIQIIFTIAESLDKWNNQQLVFDDIKFLSEDWTENDELLNKFPSLFFWIRKNKQVADELKSRYNQYSPSENKNEIPLWLLTLRMLSSQQCVDEEKEQKRKDDDERLRKEHNEFDDQMILMNEQMKKQQDEISKQKKEIEEKDEEIRRKNDEIQRLMEQLKMYQKQFPTTSAPTNNKNEKND